MSLDDYEDYGHDEVTGPGPGDDPAVKEIEPKLLEIFQQNPVEVYYETQLAVIFEKHFFHWVTVRALKLLREKDQVGSALTDLPGVGTIRFYFYRRNRYWKRRAEEVRQLVLAYSDPAVTRAIGHQGELLVDAGLPRAQFIPYANTVQEWAGNIWTATNHDLDRVFVRDGIAYGAEIKNKLSYIDRKEFQIKLNMCGHLGLRPLFIARMMPRTYMREVQIRGGFCLIMGRQFYPVALAALVHRIQTELHLPVDMPAKLEDGTLQRFLNWHLKQVARLQGPST